MFNDFVKKLDPNNLLEEGSITFLFTKNGNLHHAPYPNTHASLLANDEIWSDVVMENDNINSDKQSYLKAMKRRAMSEQMALLGRIQKSENLKGLYKWYKYEQPFENRNDQVIVFWNEQSQVVSQLLKPCLQKLIDENLIGPNDVVHVPVVGVKRVDELISTAAIKTSNLTKQQSEEMALRKRLHLMPSPEKRQAMKQLGLGGSSKNAWQAALEKGGHINPGQKYWAPHSESSFYNFKEWINGQSKK